jgi:O-antigen ligase
MSSSPISIQSTDSAPSFAGRLEGTAAAIVGAGAVGTFAATNGLVRWLVRSDAWIFFFLVTKPLFDLTWRWEFFNIFEQRVNPQAILAALVVLFNSLAAIFGRRKPRYFRRVLFLLAVATLSVIITPTSWGVNELVRLFAGVSFFFTAGIVLCDENKFDRFSLFFLGIVCVPLTLSLLQVVGLLPFEYWDEVGGEMIGRASGTYQHPLECVFFLVYAVPVALYRWEKARQGSRERKFLAVFFLLTVVALGFTFLRAGWVTIAVELGIWYALKGQIKKISLAIGALIVLGAVFSGWLSDFYQPATELVSGQTDLASGKFLRGRGLIWMNFVVSYARGGPVHWIIGMGGSVADTYLTELLTFGENEPHNDFIRILHAYGFAGLFLYLSLIVAFVREGLLLRKSSKPFRSGIGRILICSIVGILLLSLTAEPMRYPTGIWYLFVLASIVMFQTPGLNGAAVGRLPPLRPPRQEESGDV